MVDDEPNVLVTYRLILQQQGYEVSAAISSEEARNMLQKGGVDLLLCDLSLEKQQSGFDVIEFGRRSIPSCQRCCLPDTPASKPTTAPNARTFQCCSSRSISSSC